MCDLQRTNIRNYLHIYNQKIEEQWISSVSISSFENFGEQHHTNVCLFSSAIRSALIDLYLMFQHWQWIHKYLPKFNVNLLNTNIWLKCQNKSKLTHLIDSKIFIEKWYRAYRDSIDAQLCRIKGTVSLPSSNDIKKRWR